MAKVKLLPPVRSDGTCEACGKKPTKEGRCPCEKEGR
jgi:hypothetical protein